MKYLANLVAIICCPMAVFCQDITGLWKGTMMNDSTQQVLEYEIVINKENGKYTGYTHTWFLINDQKYYGVKKVKVNIAKDGKIIIRDEALVDNNYPVPPNKNVQQLNVLDLANHGGEAVLDGPFVTNYTKAYRRLTGHINVKRVSLLSKSDLLQFLQKANESNLATDY